METFILLEMHRLMGSPFTVFFGGGVLRKKRLKTIFVVIESCSVNPEMRFKSLCHYESIMKL